MEGKRLGKNFDNYGIPLFWKFWNILFHSLLEVAEYSKPMFWLIEKRP